VLDGAAQVVGDHPQYGSTKLGFFHFVATSVERPQIQVDCQRHRSQDHDGKRQGKNQFEQRYAADAFRGSGEHASRWSRCTSRSVCRGCHRPDAELMRVHHDPVPVADPVPLPDPLPDPEAPVVDDPLLLPVAAAAAASLAMAYSVSGSIIQRVKVNVTG